MHRVIIIFIIFLNSTTLCAQEKILKYVTTEKGNPPYNIDQHNGIMIEVLKTIANKISYKVNIGMYPEVRMRTLLDKGIVHCSSKAKEWLKDPSQYYFSDSVVNHSGVIAYNKQTPLNISSIKDLFSKNIGTVYGFGYPTLQKYFNTNKIKKTSAISQESLLFLLLRQQVEGIVINKLVAQWYLRSNSTLKENIGLSDFDISTGGYRIYCYKNDDMKHFINGFNKELKELKNSGQLEKILQKYQ